MLILQEQISNGEDRRSREKMPIHACSTRSFARTQINKKVYTGR